MIDISGVSKTLQQAIDDRDFGSSSIHWNDIQGIPSGFADRIDNFGSSHTHLTRTVSNQSNWTGSG